MNDQMFRDYIGNLEARKGKEETRRILEVRRWNSNVYPNVSFMSQFQQLRVICPLAVDRTLVCTYNFKLRGAPEKMFENTIAFANIVNGTGSLVLTDDLEIYNRIGLGISSEGAEWLEIGRGYDSDLPDDHGGRRGKNSTSEVYIRNMFEAWRSYMLAGENRAGAERRVVKGQTAVTSAACASMFDPSLVECEAFLVHEARLLDEAKFDEWLALFTNDARSGCRANRVKTVRSARSR